MPISMMEWAKHTTTCSLPHIIHAKILNKWTNACYTHRLRTGLVDGGEKRVISESLCPFSRAYIGHKYLLSPHKAISPDWIFIIMKHNNKTGKRFLVCFCCYLLSRSETKALVMFRSLFTINSSLLPRLSYSAWKFCGFRNVKVGSTSVRESKLFPLAHKIRLETILDVRIFKKKFPFFEKAFTHQSELKYLIFPSERRKFLILLNRQQHFTRCEIWISSLLWNLLKVSKVDIKVWSENEPIKIDSNKVRTYISLNRTALFSYLNLKAPFGNSIILTSITKREHFPHDILRWILNQI